MKSCPLPPSGSQPAMRRVFAQTTKYSPGASDNCRQVDVRYERGAARVAVNELTMYGVEVDAGRLMFLSSMNSAGVGAGLVVVDLVDHDRRARRPGVEAPDVVGCHVVRRVVGVVLSTALRGIVTVQ